MKKTLIAVLTVVMLASLSGCFGPLLDSPEYELIGEIEALTDYDYYLGYDVTITGRLKNISSYEFTYVTIKFAIYDEAGYQIGTATDSMEYLQPGNMWLFEATMLYSTDVEPYTYELIDVETW